MFSTFIQSARIAIVSTLVAVMMVFISFMSAPQAQAQAATMEELQAMIATLMAQIAAMQGGSTPVVTSSSTISIGTTIVTTRTLRIRGAAGVNAAYIASQPAGSEGVIVEGPVSKDGYNWYKVDYATGADGWNAGGWLRAKTDLPDMLGKTTVYINGNPIVTIENIKQSNALAKCKENATANPKSVVRCTWRGVEIFSTTTVKPTPRFNSATYPVDSLVVTVSAVFGAPTTGVSLVTGPTNVGTVNWGDGSAVQTVNALISGREATVKIKHTYATNGTFTITLTGLDGKTASEKVLVTTVESSPSMTYSLADVKEVTKKTVDPIPAAIDDEYTLYRIVLLNGKVHEVKVYGMQRIATRDAEFRKTGYTGDIAKLMAMATTVVSAGKITSFTATPAIVPATKNGSQEVALKWTSEGTGICAIFENIKTYDPLKLISDQKPAGSFIVKPVWTASTGITPTGSISNSPRQYTVRCSDAVKDSFVEATVLVKLQDGATPVVAAPGKNTFACDRSVATKVASGTLACYGMWDYGDDFGGDKNMCGNYSAGKPGCIIQTPVCVTGAAKASAYIGNGNLTSAQLATISTRLKVTPEVAKAGIAGLWEYKCTSPITAGAVLGASTDIYAEISKTLGAIGALLNTMK